MVGLFFARVFSSFEPRQIINLSLHTYAIILAMSIFSTVFPSYFIMKSISYLGATRVSLFNNLDIIVDGTT